MMHRRRVVEFLGCDNVLALAVGHLSRPVVTRIDLLAEVIIVRNPSLSHALSMSGYSVTDHSKSHCFVFPDDFILPPQKEVTIYCCPKNIQHSPSRRGGELVLLWKNKNGALRQAEVLNNDYDRVFLRNSENEEVSSCAQWREDPPEATRTGPLCSKHMLTLRLLFLLSGLCLLVVTTALADAFPVMLAIGYWGRLLLDTACRACVLENHNEEEDKAIVMANYTLDRLSMGCLYFSVLKSSGRTLSERVLLGVSCVLHLLSFEVRHEQEGSARRLQEDLVSVIARNAPMALTLAQLLSQAHLLGLHSAAVHIPSLHLLSSVAFVFQQVLLLDQLMASALGLSLAGLAASQKRREPLHVNASTKKQ